MTTSPKRSGRCAAAAPWRRARRQSDLVHSGARFLLQPRPRHRPHCLDDQPPWGSADIEAQVASIAVPVMLEGGDLDTITPFDVTSGHTYELLQAPRYLVRIFDSGHYAFSDVCVPPNACGEPATLTQDEAHRASLRYAVPFLLHYVAGDRCFDAYLAPAPGVVFTGDTGGSG